MDDRFTRRAFLGKSAVVAGGILLGAAAAEAAPKHRVVVWSEGTAPKNVYPDDINTAVANSLKQPLKGWDIVVASLNQPDQGVPESLLNETDVLIWWGHARHDDVKDDLVGRIVARVKEHGMGFIALHSSHYCKPFRALMGTPCGWGGGYVEDGSSLQVIVTNPKHPINRGVKDFVIPHNERYSEPFQVNTPEAVVQDGEYTKPDGTKEKSRQGMVWIVGKGRVFYSQFGHESYPIYNMPEVQHIIANGVRWAAPKR